MFSIFKLDSVWEAISGNMVNINLNLKLFWAKDVEIDMEVVAFSSRRVQDECKHLKMHISFKINDLGKANYPNTLSL